jgi:hypothetical protein
MVDADIDPVAPLVPEGTLTGRQPSWLMAEIFQSAR